MHLFIYSLLISALTSIVPTLEHQQGAETITPFIDNEMASRASKFWPNYVVITEDFKTPSGLHIREGTRSVLIRITSTGAMLDFGRDGIYTVNIERTDILDNINRAILEGGREYGIFQNRHVNQLFRISEGDYLPLSKDDIQADYYLLYFSDFSSAESQKTFRFLDEATHKSKDASIRVIACSLNDSEDDYLGRLREMNWKGPSMFHWYTKAFRQAINISKITEPTFVLIDSNGRLINKGHTFKTAEEIVPEATLDAIQQRSFYSGITASPKATID